MLIYIYAPGALNRKKHMWEYGKIKMGILYIIKIYENKYYTHKKKNQSKYDYILRG